MDPVYAGAIAGMTLFLVGIVCGFGIYVFRECRTPPAQEYTRV